MQIPCVTRLYDSIIRSMASLELLILPKSLQAAIKDIYFMLCYPTPFMGASLLHGFSCYTSLTVRPPEVAHV